MCGLNAFQGDLASPFTILGIFLQASQKHQQLLAAEKVPGIVILLLGPPVGTKCHFSLDQETVPDSLGALEEAYR